MKGAGGIVHEIIMDNPGKVASKIMVKFDGIEKRQTIECIERKFNVLIPISKVICLQFKCIFIIP